MWFGLLAKHPQGGMPVIGWLGSLIYMIIGQ